LEKKGRRERSRCQAGPGGQWLREWARLDSESEGRGCAAGLWPAAWAGEPACEGAEGSGDWAAREWLRRGGGMLGLTRLVTRPRGIQGLGCPPPLF